MSSSYHLQGQHFKAPALKGGLYLVSTPIGHLKDITLRALETLAAVDYIYCEDTRISLKLLRHYGIETPYHSYHEHNSMKAGQDILKRLDHGASIALISDAGTPLLSDPGYRLVNDCLKNNHSLIAVPGASALLCGLVVSGIASDQCHFFGFLPSKKGKKNDTLQNLKTIKASLIFYEAPSRMIETLTSLHDILGAERQCFIGRELTKKFETHYHGSLKTLLQQFKSFEHKPKGEFVLILEGALQKEITFSQEALDDYLLRALQDMSASKAAAYVSKKTGRSKSELYARILALRGT